MYIYRFVQAIYIGIERGGRETERNSPKGLFTYSRACVRDRQTDRQKGRQTERQTDRGQHFTNTPTQIVKSPCIFACMHRYVYIRIYTESHIQLYVSYQPEMYMHKYTCMYTLAGQLYASRKVHGQIHTCND